MPFERTVFVRAHPSALYVCLIMLFDHFTSVTRLRVADVYMACKL